MTDPAPPPGCPAHQQSPGAPVATGNAPGARVPLYGPDFARDPAAVYQRLRAFGSCAPIELGPGVDATLIIGYDAALQVLRGTDTFGKDSRRWRALNEGQVPLESPVVSMMTYRPNVFYADGDSHLRLRGSIDDSLARVDPNALRQYIERSADTIIDRFASTGRADLLGDYAKELPLRVLTQVFGCTPEIGDRLHTGIRGIFDGIDPERSNTILTRALVELIEKRRRRPGNDMVSWLMEHEANLSQVELIDQLVVLVGASTEPQQNLIANALRLLLADDRFAGTLNGGSLPVEDALDEVLWTDPPMANYGIHYAFHDVEVDGTRIEAGTPIVISFAAATTEPSLLSDRRAGNRAHLAWSAGPHGCPAQREARIIASVAIERLLDRLPDIELAVPVEDLVWRQGAFQRALAALPVVFPPVAPLRPVLPPEAAPEPSGGRWSASAARAGSSPLSSTPRGTASRPGPREVARRLWTALINWWRAE